MADEASENQALFDAAIAPPPAAEPPPAAPEAPAAEPPAPPPPPEAVRPEDAGIPSWRLREEAEARRVAEDRARQLEERLNQVTTHLKQNEKQPDFFDNPDAATQALLGRLLQPFVEEFRRSDATRRQEVMYLGKMYASQTHGAEAVEAAEKAFLDARDDQSLDPADYESVVQSPNRYDAVVRWHQRQRTLSTVGTDPQAWFEKQLEAKMADPKFQAQLLEKVQAGAATRPGVVSVPPSLSRTTAAASNRGESLGDMSDASLYAFATKQ